MLLLSVNASGSELHMAVKLPWPIRPFAKTQVLGDARVCPVQGQDHPCAMRRLVYPAQGLGSLSTSCPYMGSFNIRCPLSMVCGPNKTWADYFLPNNPFNTKYIPVKRKPYLSPVILMTLCAGITLLQFIILYVYVNTN